MDDMEKYSIIITAPDGSQLKIKKPSVVCNSCPEALEKIEIRQCEAIHNWMLLHVGGNHDKETDQNISS